MTVCVGIVSGGAVIGVTDRMLTAQSGEIEFETDQAKMWSFSNSIVALVSGDISLQSQILHEVDIEVKSWIRADKSKWVMVKEVVNLYCQKFREIRREYAERELLYPLGLDFPTFFSLQHSMKPEIAEDLKTKLIEYELPQTLETIFMGIDTHGPADPTGKLQTVPQLYSTYNDRISWLTTVGFGAIGIGRNHAETYLMYSGHWPQKPFSDSVLLAYSAKRRAEAAPGVGKGTDMVVVGPALGETVKVEDQQIARLAAIYEASQLSHKKIHERTKKQAAELVDKIRLENQEKKKKAEAETEPVSSPSSGSEASESKQ